MRLPPTNAIQLDDTNAGHLVADGTSPPAAWWDDQALKLFLPAFARVHESEVRDALLAAWAEMVGLIWASSSRILNAQQSPRNASGSFLVEHGREQRRSQAPGESESDYRKRLLTSTDIISPAAIVAAIQGLCEARGIPVYFQEPHANGWYTGGPTSSWMPFCSGATARWWGDDPMAPEYVRSAGYIIGPRAQLPTLWIFLRQQVGFEEAETLFLSSANLAPSAAGYLVAGASNWPCFLASASPVDEQIANDLSVLVAAGVDWTLFYDPIA